jgi:hypothetical protein
VHFKGSGDIQERTRRAPQGGANQIRTSASEGERGESPVFLPLSYSTARGTAESDLCLVVSGDQVEPSKPGEVQIFLGSQRI